MANEQVPWNFVILGNFNDDEETSLVNGDTGEIILTGDNYHDHIYDQIDGFFEALGYFEYPYTKTYHRK